MFWEFIYKFIEKKKKLEGFIQIIAKKLYKKIQPVYKSSDIDIPTKVVLLSLTIYRC